MKLTSIFIICTVLLFSCEPPKESVDIHQENWTKRQINTPLNDSLEYGKSYLSIYSQIYSISQHTTYNLTAMASLRNISDTDTIYLTKASYYGTHGELLKTYFDKPIYLAPLETTEIIIDEINVEGGTGSNFMFEWKTPKNCPEPFFEGVMNSTMGKQGLSFTTHSIRIE
ncbi:DUF3124 domain-containing protein [Psychroserpens sp. AS72]|uniref:DUF3124 domain-containing protein n=1 Tax=Psychroserpens sp. AS72 TaxID=3135775 RepID=UPI00317E437E